MADRIVQLIDGRNNDNIYPVSINDAPIITVTNTDPGAGSSLAANHFVAVTGTQSAVGTADISSNAITTAKIADGAVTADKINFATLGGNYSTTEQATNYTWIDGSVIYKKTINFGSLPNTTTKTVAHNISNLALVIKFEGVATNGTNFRPLPMVGENLNNMIRIDINGANLRAVTTSDWAGFTGYVTLYYTKSA